jgi:hypothetical protein
VRKFARGFNNHDLLEKSLLFRTRVSARRQLLIQKQQAENDLLQASTTLAEAVRIERICKQRFNRAWESLDAIEVQSTSRLVMFDSEIELYGQRNFKDCFHQMLTKQVSGYTVLLSHVLLRTLQRMNEATPVSNWVYPPGFSQIPKLWKSHASFRQAIKNLTLKLRRNKRKASLDVTYRYALDSCVDCFSHEMKESNFEKVLEGLNSHNLCKAIDGLFVGISVDGLVLLKRWRRDYLLWQRQSGPGTSNHSGIVNEQMSNIFTNPHGGGWI